MDVSSAFVAKVASHIKLKTTKGRATQICRENKENEARSSQVHSRTHTGLSIVKRTIIDKIQGKLILNLTLKPGLNRVVTKQV